MKARKVKGLRPDMPVADAAERIVRVRLEELYSFVPAALDPGETVALHDLRIAAKRLRYILEVTGPMFGPFAEKAAKRARDIQDLVGEIHDCDVHLPEVLELLEELRGHDAAELHRAAGNAEDLDMRLSARAAHRGEYRGLDVLAAHLAARRRLLFDRFLELWERLEHSDFRGKLERAVAERAPAEPPPAAAPPGTPPPARRGEGDTEHADALRSAMADVVR